jgi:predicted RNase H-like nuclease (RuvC/YqgF family)
VDLVKLKKKEEERRKNIKKSTYSLNNYNLNTLKVPPKKYGYVELSAGIETNQTEKKEAIKTTTEKKDPRQEIQYWQDLKKRLQEEISTLKQKVQKDQLQLNQLVTNYISMNLPLQKIDMKNQIDKLSADLEKDKLKLEGLQKEMDSLPEQARKAGVPPGWVR